MYCLTIFQVEVLSKKNNDTDMFCSEVEEFAIDYSLISNGQSIREREARQEIANLKEKHNCLRRGQKSNTYNMKYKKMCALRSFFIYLLIIASVECVCLFFFSNFVFTCLYSYAECRLGFNTSTTDVIWSRISQPFFWTLRQPRVFQGFVWRIQKFFLYCLLQNCFILIFFQLSLYDAHIYKQNYSPVFKEIQPEIFQDILCTQYFSDHLFLQIVKFMKIRKRWYLNLTRNFNVSKKRRPNWKECNMVKNYPNYFLKCTYVIFIAY